MPRKNVVKFQRKLRRRRLYRLPKLPAMESKMKCDFR